MRPIIITALAIILCSFCARAKTAQVVVNEKCRGSIFTEEQVTRLAEIKSPIYLGFGPAIHVHAVVDTVLCRSGKVTDIEVVEVSPPEVRDLIVAVVSQINFTPAEKNWHTASQRHRFVFDVNPIRRVDATASKKAQGRLLEEVKVIGNRKLTKEQILSWTHARVGEPYDTKTINDDLLAILHSGLFDSLESRATLEDGLRGGVIITFEIVELPTIVGVKFSGLSEAEQVAGVKALVDYQADIRVGAALDSAKLKKAVRVITDFLESKGWRDVKVDVQTESLSASEVTVTFAIAAYKFQ
jgi:hypothetical protein